MKRLVTEARKEKLSDVLAFVDEELDSAGCSQSARRQINMAVEEIFLNVSSYAYGEEGGRLEVELSIDKEESLLELTFLDSGVAFDPLNREETDIHLPGRERSPGGLGILMVKKTMDDMKYEYRDAKNVLTIKKHLQ